VQTGTKPQKRGFSGEEKVPAEWHPLQTGREKLNRERRKKGHGKTPKSLLRKEAQQNGKTATHGKQMKQQKGKGDGKNGGNFTNYAGINDRTARTWEKKPAWERKSQCAGKNIAQGGNKKGNQREERKRR